MKQESELNTTGEVEGGTGSCEEVWVFGCNGEDAGGKPEINGFVTQGRRVGDAVKASVNEILSVGD